MKHAYRDGPDRVPGARVLSACEWAVAQISALSIALIMIVVVIDVVLRYFVGRPLGWTYDVVGSYLMVAAFFLAASDALRTHNHIAIDIFIDRFSPVVIHAVQCVGYACAAVMMGVIGWVGAYRLASSWTGNDIISMTVQLPTWPTYLLLTVGSALLALRCVVRAIGHALSIITGQEMVSMPRSHVDNVIAAEGAE